MPYNEQRCSCTGRTVPDLKYYFTLQYQLE